MFLITRSKNGDKRLYHLKPKQMSYKHKCPCSMGNLRMRKEQNSVVTRTKSSQGITQDAQNEMEKRVLVCCLKENHLINDNASKEVLRVGRRKVHTSNGGFMAPKRSPFHDIGNSLLLMRQNSKAIFPLHSPLASSTENILRVILSN